MILDEIIASKRKEVEVAKARRSLEEVKRRARPRNVPHRFRDALLDAPHTPALIAELKRKSPSAGMLRERFDPVRLAQELQEAGASALSILTDEPFFGGSLDMLQDVQAFVEIPVLRKDFVLEPYQIYEAAVYQAEAVLLIVRILTDAHLEECLRTAETLGLDALVEVHEEKELARALKAGATVIGINHRNLADFTMDPSLTARLAPQIPHTIPIVAESGLKTPDELQTLKAAGVRAVLIGETLMIAPDPAAKVRELFQGVWTTS